MKRLVLSLAIAALVGIAGLAQSQESLPLWDWQHFTGSYSAGYVGFKSYGSTTDPWNGISAAGALGYNLDALSGWASLEHDFPLAGSDGHRNMARLFANARLRSWPGRASGQFYAGAGLLAFGAISARDWSGAEGHLTGSVLIHEGYRLSATYSHAFALRPGFDDFDFYRVAVVARAF